MKKIYIKSNNGFSLIEILVATVILIIIVMMMSTIFHQSSIAWDAGTRKAQGNMLGRSMLGIISRELMSTVIETNVWDVADTDIKNGSAITFVMLTPAAGTNERALVKVNYTRSGNNLTRTCWKKNASGSIIGGVPSMLTTNVANDSGGPSFSVIVPDDYTPGTGVLPEFVMISLKISKSADVSTVGARSLGPNGKRDNDENSEDYDDIRSF
ncbi:MAG: hypothetical protein A2283_04375 [Lentisphaerae bacterium RIFOXYA12_FULL_48_11]|nr:MAG: hypothetical protein A2283_04375 [Lentisphaerae bacterium RIFOXYA12_FULL_48_11]